MAKRQVKHPARNASTGAYSDGVILDGWLYISGQGLLDLATGKVVSGSIEQETRLTMTHIGKILEAAGCGFEDVVKCTCHLADIHLLGARPIAPTQCIRHIPTASAYGKAVRPPARGERSKAGLGLIGLQEIFQAGTARPLQT